MKITILTSYYTGHGHASITKALASVLDSYPVSYNILEMVDFCGPIVRSQCKKYGKITSKRPWQWKWQYNFSNKHKHFTTWLIKRSFKKKFLHQIQTDKPDLIISVHPLFVSTALDILEENNIDCKFATIIADLVTINNLWLDKRSDLVFCPTHDCLNTARTLIPDKQLRLCTLPTRPEINFVANTRTLSHPDFYTNGVHCIVASGGEGSGNFEELIDKALQHPKTLISAICGRNKTLHTQLINKYSGNHRVRVYGFVDNFAHMLATADIAIVRGSPNVLMECINLLVPIITTGTLPGQEQDNDYWAQKNGFSFIAQSPSDIPEIIENYLTENAKLLMLTKQAQAQYRDLQSAEKIIYTILSELSTED